MVKIFGRPASASQLVSWSWQRSAISGDNNRAETQACSAGGHDVSFFAW